MQNQDQSAHEKNATDPDEAAVARIPAEQADGRGLHLMTRSDLEAAIGHYDPARGGDQEDSGATSREDGVRKEMLSRYRDDPDALWRRHIVGGDRTLARLRDLASGAGNMVEVLEIVRRAAVLSRYAGAPLRVAPIVLVGPSGTGKSRIAGKISGALGTSSTKYQLYVVTRPRTTTRIQPCMERCGSGSDRQGAPRLPDSGAGHRDR